jgi:hypothetical protein
VDLNEKQYKIPIGGRWDLEDLYVFPRAYEQVYFLVYSSKEIFYVFSDLRIIFIGGYSPSFALHLTQPL